MTAQTRTHTPPHRPHPAWAAARAHALTAAAVLGLAVFPITPTKLPALATAHPGDTGYCTGACGRPGHGVHDATADPVRVRVLFAAAPWATGYGIACGRAPHHLIGVDLDRKNGTDGVQSFSELASRARFVVPDTVTVATPTGGLHLWLTAPADARIPNSAGQLGPGIDVRGTGGYLVGPGSRTARGRYTYAPGSGPAAIAPAPPALLPLLAPAPAPAGQDTPGNGRRGGLDALVRFVLNSGPGELNNRLYWAARRAFEDAASDDATATAALLRAAVAKGHPEPGAARTIASARKATRGAVR